MENPSKAISLKKKRFLLKDSDRSGFTYKNVELFLDEGSLVGGDEIDSPPPSKRLIAAEGDVSPGDTRINYTSYSLPANLEPVVQTVTTASTISLNHQVDNAGNYTYIKSTVFVNGSASGVILDSNPQIALSSHGDRLTLQGAGTSFVLQNTNGLSLYTSYLQIDSGTVVNFIYNATDSLWHETSRMNPNFALIGAY